MPHNVFAWFFSTTGSIGGIGYVFFVCSYIWVFCKEMKRSDISWFDAVGLWVFLAITIHGMVDAGVIYKAIARLLYLVMGLSISYDCLADRQRIPEEGDGSDRSG
jgi:O-antigen ligase